MADPKSEKPSSAIQFHYIKNPAFRVLHVDGAYGGITPRGLIHCAVYSERPAIVRIAEQDFDAVASRPVGDQRTVDSREGIVRELDADLMMSLPTAMELRDWLTLRIDELTKLMAEPGRGAE